MSSRAHWLIVAILLVPVPAFGWPRRDTLGDPLPAGAVARVGSVRLRHGHFVSCVAFTPDGRHVISADRRGAGRLWDAAAGREVRDFPGHRLGIHALALSPDGKLLATAGGEPALRLCDVATGREVRVFEEQKAEVWCVAFAPDGKTLAVGDRAGRARLYDVATGKQTRSLGSFISVIAVEFSPDGKTLATGALHDGGVRLWDRATGQVTRTVVDLDPDGSGVSYSPDGKQLLTTGSTIRLWDVRTGELLHTLTTWESGNAVTAWSPDGRIVALAGDPDREEVLLFDAALGKPLRSLPGGERGGCCLAFSPDGKRIALGTYEGAVRILDVATGRDAITLPGHAGPMTGVLFAPGGRSLITAGDRTVRFRDAMTLKEQSSWKHPENIASMTLTPDGRLIAAGGAGERGQKDRRIVLWSAATGESILEIRNHQDMQNVASLAVSADGRFLAWAGGAPNSPPRVWDLARNVEAPWLAQARDGVVAVAFGPDGKTLAAADEANLIRLFSIPGGELRQTLTGHSGTVTALSFTPDGGLMASASMDGTVRLWEVSSGKESLILSGHEGGVSAMALSADGRHLLGGGADGQVALWRLADGRLLSRREAHRGEVTAVTVAPDRRRFATASRDGTALLWELSPDDYVVRPVVLTAAELDSAWESLSSANSVEAFRALGRLASAAGQSEAFLERRLSEVEMPTADRLRMWITELDHRRFAVRERAQAELEGWGPAVHAGLNAALRGNPSLEVRRRIEAILAKTERVSHWPQEARLRRALRALEMLGTAESRRILDRLEADGVPGTIARARS